MDNPSFKKLAKKWIDALALNDWNITFVWVPEGSDKLIIEDASGNDQQCAAVTNFDVAMKSATIYLSPEDSEYHPEAGFEFTLAHELGHLVTNPVTGFNINVEGLINQWVKAIFYWRGTSTKRSIKIKVETN